MTIGLINLSQKLRCIRIASFVLHPCPLCVRWLLWFTIANDHLDLNIVGVYI